MRRECPNCGSFVSKNFYRVFSDNEGDIPGCTNCKSHSEIRRESGGYYR